MCSIVPVYFRVKRQREPRWPRCGWRFALDVKDSGREHADSGQGGDGPSESREVRADNGRYGRHADRSPFEFLFDVARRLPPLGGIRFEASLDDVDELRREALQFFSSIPSRHLLQHDSQRKMSERGSASRPSRCSGAMYAAYPGPHGFASRFGRPTFRQAEVEHLHAGLRQHHVAGFQIAVDDSLGVCGGQGVGHLTRSEAPVRAAICRWQGASRAFRPPRAPSRGSWVRRRAACRCTDDSVGRWRGPRARSARQILRAQS